MRITFEELMTCPKDKSIDEWHKECQRIKRLRAKLYKLSIKRDELEDALEVLTDEAGSDRWKRKKAELEKVLKQIDDTWAKCCE